MIINELTKKVAKIAQSNKEGMTLSINNLEPIRTGFVASYKATQNSFSETDLQSVVNHALSHDGVVGKWFNDKDGKYYYDSNKVFSNLDDALKFAKENEQLAIFDLDNKKEIRLDNQPLTKEYNFSTFADWMLSTASQVVKYYKGDILIDCKQIVELRNKYLFNLLSGIYQGFNLYWGVRETGTWISHVESDKGFSTKDLMQGLGAKHVYFITFWYDKQRNEVITVTEVDKHNL